jgi:hypothetical protein
LISVHHQGRERLALDIFGDDQERTARLHHGFENRQQCLQAGQLAFVQQDIKSSSSPVIFSALVMKYGDRWSAVSRPFWPPSG